MSLKGKAVRAVAAFDKAASVRLAFRLLGLDWKEEEHPRDGKGQFSPAGGGSGPSGEVEELTRQIAGLSRFGEQGKKRKELTERLKELTGESKKPEVKPARPKSEKVAVKEKEYPVTPHKTAQFEILRRANPMTDDYHVGIRKPSDIRSAEEALGSKEEDDGYAYPDFTREDGEKALRSGRITLYSSHPIGDGVFVSPSRMMSSDYAGDGKVYSKTVPLADVAWINADEGQYAHVAGNSGAAQRTRTGSSTETIDLVAGRDNYMTKPDYREARQKMNEAARKVAELKEEWTGLGEQLEGEIVDTPEIRELGRPYADLFDAYTEAGKEIKKKRNKVREDLKAAENEERKYTGQVERITAANRRREKSAFSPEPLTAAEQDRYDGFTLESDVPYIREKLQDGSAWIAEMDPREYLERCAFEIFSRSTLESTVQAVETETVNRYADQMEAGESFSLPYLNYSSGNQEGRHRAVAAILNGYSKIPVVIVGRQPEVLSKDRRRASADAALKSIVMGLWGKSKDCPAK